MRATSYYRILLITAFALPCGCSRLTAHRTTSLAAPVVTDVTAVRGQSSASGPNFTAEPRGATSHSAGSAPVGVPACPLADYWIVSSRQCDFSPARGTTCCLQYFHRSGDVQPVPVDEAAFRGALDPNVPVCFIIHGSYNWWGDVVSESRRINRWIREAAPHLPVQVVSFTWPSDGNMPFLFPIDIAILGRKSSAHALYLSQVIAQLPPQQPVCLVGHSHGARSAAATLHLLGGGVLEDGSFLVNAPAAPRRVRSVLIAAAVDHDWLNPGDRYGQALCQAERVLILRNSRDFWLGVYPTRKIIGDRALGQRGLGGDDRASLDMLNSRVVELDAAPVVGFGHQWVDYYTRPEMGRALVPYVYFHDE